MINIQNHIDHFTDIWEKSPEHYPLFNRIYSEKDKAIREANFDQIQLKLKSLQSQSNVSRLRESNPESSFFQLFRSFLQNIFDFEKEHLDIILADEFRNVSKEFFHKARAFGPELSPESIYQGLRNVWIMNGLQLMMNIPVKITPSVFAYSMIYPYSDNLLDDPDISEKDKHDFSERFNLRLHGEKTKPVNYTESQLFNLLAMFEEQYDRDEFPEVYESLYAIQKGQTDSLNLLKANGLKEHDVRRVCFEKGGASVIADGYLVAGKLTRQEEQALFGYGVYLQLLDDIQDIKEDAASSTQTMCSLLSKTSTGEFVNKTIHFGRTALTEMKCFKASNTDMFLKLMYQSIEMMIIEAVGLNESSFPGDYLAEMEKYSPLHFGYLRLKKSQSKSQRLELFRKYFGQTQPEG